MKNLTVAFLSYYRYLRLDSWRVVVLKDRPNYADKALSSKSNLESGFLYAGKNCRVLRMLVISAAVQYFFSLVNLFSLIILYSGAFPSSITSSPSSYFENSSPVRIVKMKSPIFQMSLSLISLIKTDLKLNSGAT